MGAETKCLVCKSSRRAAVDSALLDGVSIRGVARQFSFGRGSIFRHQRDCIKLRRTADEAAKREATAKREALSGDIESSFRKATERLARAEESGDMNLILRAQAGVSKLLALRGKMTPAKPREMSVTATGRPQDRINPKFCIAFPPEYEADFALLGIRPPTDEEQREALATFDIRFVDRRPAPFAQQIEPKIDEKAQPPTPDPS